MIELKKACEIAMQEMENSEVESILDIGTSWVIGLRDATTKEAPDIPPLQIMKDDGTVNVFFPPKHAKELKNAIEVDIPKE